MNGKERYTWLREEHPQLARRVIFTTGDISDGDLQHFPEETGRPFLPGPLSPGSLKAVVKQAPEGLSDG